MFKPALFHFCFLAVALPVAWGQQQQSQATLEGSVVNRITGQALKNVRLSLQAEDRTAGERSTSTSENGTFRFVNVTQGKYLLFAERSGFESQYYTASTSSSQGTLLNINSSEVLKDLSIKLSPYAAVSGRVVDQDGEPLAHVSVQAMRRVYLRGKRQFLAVGQAMTDDLGEYRIFEIPAGRYVIQAKLVGEGVLIDQHRFSYVPAYYPNAQEPLSASEIPLAPGQTQRGVDFLLRRTATYSVQGQILGSQGEQQGVMVYLQPRTGAGLAEKSPVPAIGGRFELPAVLPGSYILAADQFGGSGGALNSARVELDVRDQDIKGIALTLTRPGELTGKVQMETSKTAAAPEFAERGRSLQVSLQRMDDDTAFVGGAADEKGRFSLKGVSAGLYKVHVNNLAAGVYIKSIRAGDYDIAETGLDYSRGVLPGELTILLSSNGGTLKGAVKSESGTSPGGIQVLAIAASGVRRLKTAVSDQNGSFEIKGLAPGDYRIFAFEDVEPGAAEDPDFMKRFAGKSKQVTIKELATETVEPATISAAVSRAGQ